MKKTICSFVLFAGLASACFAAAAPKRMLIVTNSNGFRHSSIEVTEKVLRELAQKSGDFTVTSTSDHPDYPDYTSSGLFGTQVTDGIPAQITYIRKLNDRISSPLAPLQAKIVAARDALAAASISGNRPSITTRANELAAAELALAMAKAEAFATLQRGDAKLTAAQVAVLTGNGGQQGAAARTSFAPQVGAATPLQQKAIAEANRNPQMIALAEALNTARAAMNASFTDSRETRVAKAAAVATAEQNLASARAEQMAAIQRTAGRFQPAVLKTLVSRFSLPETGTATADGAAKVFADLLNVDALKNYDGVFFASTVGILPFPDLDGFIKWVNDGGAWLGNHASSDSMHGITKYYDMMGGEFTGHGQQTSELMTVTDPNHPIGKAFGTTTIRYHDEMYTFENSNFDFSKVHTILNFTVALNDTLHTPVGAPGAWPSIWIRNLGKGRVFYSALGHREDVVDPNYILQPRMNSPEVAKAYQAMLLEGVRWGLGITQGDATPQAKVPTPAGGPNVQRAGRGAGGPAAPAAAPAAP